MIRWDYRRALDPKSESPLFLQLVRAIATDIADGTLKPGTRLPGSRTLATQLRVNRNTVLTAYEELAAEGWVVARRAGGTFVDCLLLRRALANGAPTRQIQFEDEEQASPAGAVIRARLRLTLSPLKARRERDRRRQQRDDAPRRRSC